MNAKKPVEGVPRQVRRAYPDGEEEFSVIGGNASVATDSFDYSLDQPIEKENTLVGFIDLEDMVLRQLKKTRRHDCQ